MISLVIRLTEILALGTTMLSLFLIVSWPIHCTKGSSRFHYKSSESKQSGNNNPLKLPRLCDSFQIATDQRISSETKASRTNSTTAHCVTNHITSLPLVCGSRVYSLPSVCCFGRQALAASKTTAMCLIASELAGLMMRQVDKTLKANGKRRQTKLKRNCG